MSFTKKTWTDRISEFITRRLLTKSDGSTEQVTVSRDEGEITQEGTPLNAESFNDLEGRIESAFSDTDDAISQLNTHLTDLEKESKSIKTDLAGYKLYYYKGSYTGITNTATDGSSMQITLLSTDGSDTRYVVISVLIESWDGTYAHPIIWWDGASLKARIYSKCNNATLRYRLVWTRHYQISDTVPN